MPRLTAALIAATTTHALRCTRRQGLGGLAGVVAIAPQAARALPDSDLDLAFTTRTKALRPLPPGTCDAQTPSWLAGDWTVAASRFEGVKFPRSGSYEPRAGFSDTIAGARRGTILSIPNAGAAPRGYARSYARTLATSSDVTSAASTLKAFWAEVSDVSVEQQKERSIIRYTAPTVKRGVLPQRIVAERLACAAAETPTSLIVAEKWAQASIVDDAEAALSSLSGTYTAWHRYDLVDGGNVRETLRVAAFDDDPAAEDPRPCAVYDYSFFLRR